MQLVGRLIGEKHVDEGPWTRNAHRLYFTLARVNR